ncbi:hypothetical protein CRG98_008177 [Punica granatum]|uniref:Uncharacterized protein n=1 Tax=Punica granatum TaxID=22663 RepID=A0A2I0KSX0_PUNGR|nr:hypothetical protein CRG98_008177 [Punica granatum]
MEKKKHGNRPVSNRKRALRTCVVQGSSRPHPVKYGRELPWLTWVGGISSAPIRTFSRHANVLHAINGARACTFGELGARGVRLESTGGARARGALGWTRERAATGALFT